VKTWVDKQGVPHTTVTSAPQKIAYAKEETQTGPIEVKPALAWWERIWLFIKDAAGFIAVVLLCIGGIWLWFFIQRQRRKSAAPTT
jgi:hypothetical protein